ncbi:MAG: stage III sporulation AC/AD family protein [Christensenellaceae bacterium]|jgi:stage III sporulation protein AD|nr:stage III sporulation AC/AD family protein [Christensenellaceae bacterium]
MVIKAVIIGIIGAIATGVLKTIKPEISVFAAIASGIIILTMIIAEVVHVKETFIKFTDSTSVNIVFPSIIKIIGLGYLTEYGAGIAEDYGTNLLGKKILLAGKVGIFVMSLPAVIAIVDTIGIILE